MGEEIRITYETLYDLVRREKGREELQKLDASFFADVGSYLTEKHSIASGPNESFFSDEERQKTVLQLSNSCKLLRELYERREKKILSMALIKARTEKALIDTSAMLTQELELFAKLIELLSQHRQGLLNPLLLIGGIHPSLSPTKIALEPQPLKMPDQPVEEASLTIEFLAEVPKFVGKSLEIYGPYAPGQQAMLPADIANILIEKGRARVASIDTPEMEPDLSDQPIEVQE